MDTITLLRTIGYPYSEKDRELHSSKKLYNLARKNKVESLYVESLKTHNELADLQEEWQNRREFQENFDHTLRNIGNNIPDQFEYAIVKSAYDFWVDSKDIDIIVFEPELDLFKQVLVNKGYEFVGDSPTSFDVKDPDTNIQIDIQSDFSLQRVVYFDKETIRDRIKQVDVRGTSLPIASKPDDLALIVIHSITEQLFILKEFFATVHALEKFSRRDFERFIEIIEANDIAAACRAFFPLIEDLCTRAYDRKPPYLNELLQRYPSFKTEREAFRKTDFKTPHRYTRSSGLRTICDKATNSTFVISTLTQLPYLIQPATTSHILHELLTRRKREHYVHDMSDNGGDQR